MATIDFKKKKKKTQPLLILDKACFDITIDSEASSREQRYEFIKVIGDRFTKISHFVPFRETLTVSQYLTIFIRVIL